MPLLLVAPLVLLLTVLASLVGIRIGRRMRGDMTDGERSQLYGVQASLLGLLALLLGFSFGIAETRYDLRKQLVVDEANAIGTARLRTAAIPDDPGLEIQQLLERYVDFRLDAVRARDSANLRIALDAAERLQREVWTRATELARRDPRSMPAALLLQALNDVIDLHAKRVAASQNHIPVPVLVVLLIVAVAAMGWVGVGVGLGHRRGTATTLMLSVLISAVVTVIVDLDQPRRGLIRVSQGTMIDLQRSFH